MLNIYKGHSLLRERIGLRFSFIDNEKKAYPLNLLCKVMQVSRSGYYRWKKHSVSAKDQERAQLIPKVRGLHQKSKATYGSRRMAQELKALGFRCGKHKAVTLMKLAGVMAKQRSLLQNELLASFFLISAKDRINNYLTFRCFDQL